ncbi:MAG: hypothetical protein EOM87_06215 [Clostridia bacterium]|nr:hypothetical protein [Clostridia bacterium]
MEREYHLAHNVLCEKFFNNSHEFELWYNEPGILKGFIDKAYGELCEVAGKDDEKCATWPSILCTVKNDFHYMVIEFGEVEKKGLCSKIILANYRKPRYFTVERGEDYLYYLCEWARGSHKTYCSVINDTDYVLERIAMGIMK